MTIAPPPHEDAHQCLAVSFIVLNYLTAADGSTKRIARGYRNFGHYRLQLVLNHGRIREGSLTDTDQYSQSQVGGVEPVSHHEWHHSRP